MGAEAERTAFIFPPRAEKAAALSPENAKNILRSIAEIAAATGRESKNGISEMRLSSVTAATCSITETPEKAEITPAAIIAAVPPIAPQAAQPAVTSKKPAKSAL